MANAERRKGERGGLVPIMKGFDALKQEFAEVKRRMDEIEKQMSNTGGKVEGILSSGTFVECPECEGLLQAEKFPKHWLKMHSRSKTEKILCPACGENWITKEEAPKVASNIAKHCKVTVEEVLDKYPELKRLIEG